MCIILPLQRKNRHVALEDVMTIEEDYFDVCFLLCAKEYLAHQKGSMWSVKDHMIGVEASW